MQMWTICFDYDSNLQPDYLNSKNHTESSSKLTSKLEKSNSTYLLIGLNDLVKC
jgi:hypothetical protein